MSDIQITSISYDLWRNDPLSFAKALGESLAETGFAIVSEHGISQDVIDRAAEQTKAFFDLPSETKLNYADPENGFQRGYSPLGTENAKGHKVADYKEFWHTGRYLEADSPFSATMKSTPLVAELPQFNIATQKLYNALDGFGVELLRALALYLDLNEDYFDDKVVTGNSILRLLHYPPQIDPPLDGAERAAAHEDINLITLLLGAEEAGLQARHRNGTWLDVKAPEGAIVINAGDMLQRLTAWVIPSTTHRVLNPSALRAKYPRYSTPFFLHPNQDFLIDPLPNCVAKTGRSEAPILAEDYLNERLFEIGLLKS